MALNMRQINFITRLKTFSSNIECLYGKAHMLKKEFDEEFDTGKDHALADEETALEATYSMGSADVEAAITSAENFMNYWTGVAVDTKEYGKDLRRIK